ncbi:MAG: alpha/beta hydrolase [Chlorobaculum sp.]|nr:alpha/beta hydrolase [Chlorobaculum sp.]
MLIEKKNSFRSTRFLFLVSGAALALAYVILIPWNIPNLSSHPHPATDYNDALRRIDALREQEAGVAMNPLCTLQFMTHGRKTARTVVLVHGYTNCPQQFRELGRRFFERGDNVLIAPLPWHGLADRMNTAQAKLTAGAMAAYADEVVDIGQGLGERVVMMGISAGGVTTAWAAQNRRDLDCAVVIAPTLGFKPVSVPFTAAVMNLFSTLPDSWAWWNEELKENVQPPYGYPRCSKHVITDMLRLGFVVEESAMQRPPMARKIVMVSNANDEAVNNESTQKIADLWKSHGATVETYTFDASLKIGHDIIDPNQPDQKVEVVYPKLIELCGE